jgi:hypothetical protein
MVLTTLQAAPPKGTPPKPSLSEVLWVIVPLFGVCLVGVLILYFVDRWRKRVQAGEDNDSSSDQLSHFRTLYERGEMSREEYDRVKTLLAGQLRKEMNVPAPPAAPAITESPDTNIQAQPPTPQSPPPPEAPPP